MSETMAYWSERALLTMLLVVANFILLELSSISDSPFTIVSLAVSIVVLTLLVVRGLYTLGRNS